MTKTIIMPKYGLQQDNGTVVEWRVKEGDHVNKGDILLDLETDKALFEYESPESGYVRKLVAQNGEEVPVLSVIAIITDEADETIENLTPASTDSPTEEPRQITDDTAEREPTLEASTQRIKRSPAARRRARELNIDLANIAGTGPGDRIVLADVELAASAAPSSTTLSRMRQAIGRTMAYSKSTIPHFYVATEIDMTDAETWRKNLAETDAIKLSVTDLFVKAAADALTQYPALNASLDGDTAVIVHDTVDIGLAVGTDDGLVVPVIPNADQAFLTDLADERGQRVEEARQGRLRGDASATFTISNLGMYGITSFTAIVNPPEAAILAVGAAIARVVPIGDTMTIAVRQIAEVTLSADHRLVDGVVAAQFLQALKQNLEDTNKLESWL
ncbi:MAG: 2-oxo acid dehydrogenase subunit E2 [Gemmatimonadetes bacterium]|nr:2-oxo acid dehydrogenase subunit E2 [Gemmatimonadota bacterium]MYF73486.1 2-oxo acid dehydrogenase subunit E2 [Gemmatimonadota bacterium]MYK54439.1 2-oxo acid dehydrogenase subunit E2 [Gemmatimonadota bacterium]